MNNHTQELVIYHFCCLLNIMIRTGFICKYTELWGGGLIVCISAASSLVSIILKSIFLLQNKDNNIFTIFFSATTDHLAEGRD